MTMELLLREFTTVVETPDAIERLRSLVIGLALAGQLSSASRVPGNDKELQPDAVRRGMAHLLAQRPKYRWNLEALPPTVDASAPPGWLRTPLGNTGLYINGLPFKPSDWGPTGRPIIRIQNLSGINSEYNRTEREFPNDHLAQPDDLLVSWSATLDAFVWPGPEGVVNQHIFKVIPNPEAVRRDFLYWLLKHAIRHLARSQHAHGLAMMHINREPFLAHPVSLPPLAEQEIIVAKVHELMALCDELTVALREADSRRDQLRGESLKSLAAAVGPALREFACFFVANSPRMLTDAGHVAEARQAILDLAVTGRLLPTDSTWESTTLGSLTSVITSGSRGWAEYYADSGPSFLRAQNVRFGCLRLDDLAHVRPPQGSEGRRTRVEVGDLVIVITGAGVTNPALVDRDLGEAYVSQHLGLIKPLDRRHSAWIRLCLMARAGCRSQLLERAYGSGKPGLNLENLRQLVVPVPAIGDQERIVARIGELMGVCDELESALTLAAMDRARLLASLLRGALADSR